MFDRVAPKNKSIVDEIFISDLSKVSLEQPLEQMAILGNLSEAELRFLSLSKEKKSSVEIIKNIMTDDVTLKNYEQIFCLQNYVIVGGTVNPNQEVRNIRYKDKKGVIVATVQVDIVNKKIRMQNFGDILPRQESFSPYHVGTKLENMARFNKWVIEDGGVNQFNENTEIRYKDNKGNVMAAVIKKPNGTFDTIAEYEYNKLGNKIQMLLTNHYGQSKVIYDGSEQVNQITRIDIDADGMIIEITKTLS